MSGLRPLLVRIRGRIWFGRGRQLARLESELAAHIPVLPVVNEQLAEAQRDMAQSVTEVCGAFENIAARARESVQEAAGLLDGSEQAGISGLVTTSRTTLENVLDDVLATGEVSQRALAHMDALERAVGQVSKLLAELDKTSFSATILGLNARIEAAHIGELGMGFEHVAQEIWRHSQRSSEITAEIRDSIKLLSAELTSAVCDLKDVAATGRQRSEHSRREVQAALEGIEELHRDMSRSLARSTGRDEELANEIAQAVMRLQFQDRVNQRLQHASEALAAMAAAVSEPLGELGHRVEMGQDMAARLSDSYTMEAERAVLAAETNEEAGSSGDVELF